MNTYRPKRGANYGIEKAEALGAILESIGDVTPAAVVEVARHPESEIHELFTWDDTQAAQKFRESEASHHIRHLQIVVNVDGAEIETRAFHSISIETPDAGPSEVYRHFDVVRSDEAMRRQVIERARMELIGWRQRYKEYGTVFSDVFSVVDALAVASTTDHFSTEAAGA